MALISITKAKKKKNLFGYEIDKIDPKNSGKKIVINEDDVVRIEKWDTGSQIFFRDGTDEIVVESLDAFTSQQQEKEKED